MTNPDELRALADECDGPVDYGIQPRAAAALRACAERIEAAQEWHDGIFEGLSADLENGVRWLNEQAAAKFRRDYPELAAALDKPMDPPHD